MKDSKVLLILFILILAVISCTSSINTEDVVDFENGATYDYSVLLERAYLLAEKYPDLLMIETIGYSLDHKPIVKITLTENVAEHKRSKKYYLGLDAGIHGKEGITSIVLLKTFELYCQGYYGADIDIDFDIKDILDQVVFQGILCCNPDGFDISRYHLEKVVDKDVLISVMSTDYSDWKANLRGVDLNRNFDCYYYDYETKRWIGYWGYSGGGMKSENYKEIPGPSRFGGYEPDSEPETLIIKDFYSSKPFRSMLTVHTRGEILYYDAEFMPEWYDLKSTELAMGIYKLNGFTPQVNEREEYMQKLGNGDNGTFTDWAIGEFAKPAFTIELVQPGTEQPTPQSYYDRALERFINIPLFLAIDAINTAYYDHKVYIDGLFYQDYMNLEYAEAIALKNGGKVYSYKGEPIEGVIKY